MLTVPLAAVSAVSAINGAIAAEDGAKRAETGDAFATLLGMQIAVAAGGSSPEPAIARPALPKGGKALPVVADVEPNAIEPAAPDLPAIDDPAPAAPAAPPPPPPQPELPALPGRVLALISRVSNAPVAALAVPATISRGAASAHVLPVPLAPEGAQPAALAVVQPVSEAQVPQPELRAPRVATTPAVATEITPKPDAEGTEEPAPARPHAAPHFSLPAQAAARAVLVRSANTAQPVDPIKSPPVLPEQAAVQATVALAARGKPERAARVAQAVAAVALPVDAAPPSAVSLAPLHALKDSLADAALSAQLPTALGNTVLESDQPSAPQATALAPSAPPPLARHDFAAMIDRLIEARDMAGVQPVAMTLRHDDFGAVSLDFRTADDGLTVTMASPDPEFARAVNAAAASGAASQGDLSRQSGEPASSRQHGGGSAGDDPAGQSRVGSREAERDSSRQRRDQPPPQRSAPRQQGRSGIFA